MSFANAPLGIDARWRCSAWSGASLRKRSSSRGIASRSWRTSVRKASKGQGSGASFGAALRSPPCPTVPWQLKQPLPM